MAHVEYQVMAEDEGEGLYAGHMASLLPGGCKDADYAVRFPPDSADVVPTYRRHIRVAPSWYADSPHSRMIGLPSRSAALMLREAIRQKYPSAEVRIYEQPLVPGEDEEYELESEEEFLDENEGNCMLDGDGIFVAKGPRAI